MLLTLSTATGVKANPLSAPVLRSWFNAMFTVFRLDPATCKKSNRFIRVKLAECPTRRKSVAFCKNRAWLKFEIEHPDGTFETINETYNTK